jgi:4-oxalocrotonate tautomerase
VSWPRPLFSRRAAPATVRSDRLSTVSRNPSTQEFAMPILNVKLCATPSPEISLCIAATLTDLTVEILKKKRELTAVVIAVVIEYVAPTAWFVAGARVGAQPFSTFHLDIKVTEGTNTKDEKAAYVSRVFTAIENVIGPVAPASYIVIHDVRGDSWSYQGETQEYRYVRGKAL